MPAFACGQIGTPYALHRDDWMRLAPLWKFYTEVHVLTCTFSRTGAPRASVCELVVLHYFLTLHRAGLCERV